MEEAPLFESERILLFLPIPLIPQNASSPLSEGNGPRQKDCLDQETQDSGRAEARDMPLPWCHDQSSPHPNGAEPIRKPQGAAGLLWLSFST